jgi:hypothetical protein
MKSKILFVGLLAAATEFAKADFSSSCKVTSMDNNAQRSCQPWGAIVSGEYEYEYELAQTCIPFQPDGGDNPKFKSGQTAAQFKGKFWCATIKGYDGTTLRWGVCDPAKLPSLCFPPIVTSKPTTSRPTPPTISTKTPTYKPGTTRFPTKKPTTGKPTKSPTSSPTPPTTRSPTTLLPTKRPTRPTTHRPTRKPTRMPTYKPGSTRFPTTHFPTTREPTTLAPTNKPTTGAPSRTPTTSFPTKSPKKTKSPTKRTG